MSRELRRSRKTGADAAVTIRSKPNERRSKIIAIPTTLLDRSSGDRSLVTVVKLRHPRTGTGEMFLFDSSNQNVHQLTQFKEGLGSWFIGDSVQEDGSLVFATPIDPLFLILPYLIPSTKFRPLDQIIHDIDFPECDRLLSCAVDEQIENVAELRKSDSLKAYRYHSSKCMSWLNTKVKSLIAVLKTKNIDVSTGARAATYTISKRERSTADEEAYMRYAHGLVSEYLPESVSKDLREHLSLADEPLMSEEPAAKRRKVEGSVTPLEDYSKGIEKSKQPNKQVTKLTAIQKSLMKTDKTGMKNISSFFAKRS